jgi:hypothetical protein
MKTASNPMNAQVRELTDQELALVVGGDTAKSGGTTTSTSSGTQTSHPAVFIPIAILIG